MMKHLKSWLCMLLAALMLLGSVSGFAESAGGVRKEGQLSLTDLESGGAAVYLQDGRVTFVEGACTSEPVRSMEDAAAVVNSMISLLGGDERTRFEPWNQLQDPTGNIYYVFQQMYAGITVPGGAVKVVTDADGRMIGLVSSVENELPEAEEAEGISAEEAEETVLQVMRSNYQQKAELLEGHTEVAVLPVHPEIDMESDEDRPESHFVWVVYTSNPGGSVKQASDLPYLAHYVTMSGEYLYSLPTIVPGDEAAITGSDAVYVFEFMEPAEYTGMVTLSDGTEREISVTLMRDSRTGVYYLGNIERRIVVGDCYEFLYNQGHVVVEASLDNTGWDDSCLLSLYNYCLAWDYYKEIGWKGGDNQGTPLLILKDFCNSYHEPIDNAAYAGHFYGWQVFLSSSANDYAQCLDILCHEFTHCVTGSVMTYNAYLNDYGAINEAMSDIHGNICEMLNGMTEDATWMIGENSQSDSFRSMSDPHQYQQPEFTWDYYYQTNVKTPTAINDQGGVHTNSSLLNSVAWRLCEKGGMTLEEARIFWFTVDCSMVPGTDYAQLSVLMPWVLKNVGMEKYGTALEAAIDATRLRSNEIPEILDDDRAMAVLTLPDQEIFQDGNWAMTIVSVDAEGFAKRVSDILDGEGEYKEALDQITAILLEESADAENESDESGIFGSLQEKLARILKDYFSDLIHSGMGVAGQDGRTVRLICGPGRTVPLLYRLELDSDEHVRSAGLAVYTAGRWIDVGSILAKLKEMTDPDSTAMNDFLNQVFGDSDSMGIENILEKGLELLSKVPTQILDPEWVINQLFYRIERGAVNEIPSTGLEEIKALTSEEFPMIDEIFNFQGTDQDDAALESEQDDPIQEEDQNDAVQEPDQENEFQESEQTETNE